MATGETIAEQIADIAASKAAIAAAIAAKGVTVPSGAKLANLAPLVGQISGGGGGASRIGYGFVAPGSPLVIIGGESSCFTLVRLVDDMADTRSPCLISRVATHDYWICMAYTKNAAKNAYHCYILDDDLKPVWEFWCPRGNGRILPYCVIVEGSAYIRTENALERYTLNDDGTGTLVKSINLPLRGYYQGICRPQIAYNPKSGHLLVGDNASGDVYYIGQWSHYDLELNALGTKTVRPEGDISDKRIHGTWLILKGWLYLVDNYTLYRALADDTLVEVVASDGTHLRWGTADAGGTQKTWYGPIICLNTQMELYDGLHKFALTYGEEDEIVLGPKQSEAIAQAVGTVGSLCQKWATVTFASSANAQTLTATIYPNRLNNSAETMKMYAIHYGTYGDIRPLLIMDTKKRTFDVMMVGAVMVNYSYGMDS